MKHLIVFLGYAQSRIQHPVYRSFVQAPVARRNASLLFLSRPLEEREVVHEVNELRRREGRDCDVQFHICATLSMPNIGQQIVQAVTMIHSLYGVSSNVYGLLPYLDSCPSDARNATWKNLTVINKCVTDYPDLRIIAQCYLYTENQQHALATFLYQLCNESALSTKLAPYDYVGQLNCRPLTGDESYVPDFPKVFATFGATGIKYPDDEVRYYLHQSYLNALLKLSRPAHNPIDIEQCNEHVERLLNNLPLKAEQLNLTSDKFIDLPEENRRNSWQNVRDYWSQCVMVARRDLDDRPRDEWMNVLRRTLETYYQTRYREMGVEMFYDHQKKLTGQYRAVILEQLRLDLQHILREFPYPPDTSKDIVRSLVNRLQQLVVSFDTRRSNGEQELHDLNRKLMDQTRAWDGLGFFERLRGKDKELMSEHLDSLTTYYVTRTEVLGASFAEKLLNELIPLVESLPDQQRHLGDLCQGALDSTQHYLDTNPPEDFIDKIFDPRILRDAAHAIEADHDALANDYNLIKQLLYGNRKAGSNHLVPVDSEMLLQQLREALTDKIDAYLGQRILDGTITPVLDISVMERLSAAFAEKGGLAAMLESLKNETALTLRFKGEGGYCEQYLLIASDGKDLDAECVKTEDNSSVHLLHILTGISLTDLDGFAGQRMFVEPSMF